MIHFDFIVDDIDAENIIGAIRERALRNDEYIMEYMARTDLSKEAKEGFITWLIKNKQYTLDLVDKMLNSRV